ncbi:hypothetical protein P9112_006466 [Eukaryota sp. TZLM1-RC]
MCQEGQKSFNDKDHQEAFCWFQRAAEAGNRAAMYYLGCCIRNGKGVDQDHQQAFHKFKKGAEAGNARAMPLVRKLSSDQTDDSFGKKRADLVAPGIDGVLNVVDVVSVDVCKNSAARLVYSADSPLSNAEKNEINKYEEPLAQLGRVEHVKYQFVPFAISLFGNIGPSGLHFLENFKKVLLNRSGKTMNSTFWLNRIVFCIF